MFMLTMLIFGFSLTEVWEDNEEDLEMFDDQDNCANSTCTSSALSPAKTLTMWLVVFLLHL